MIAPQPEEKAGVVIITRVNRVIIAISVAGLLANCAATDPPQLPPNNPANPLARESIPHRRSFLMADATSQAINDRLTQNLEAAEKPSAGFSYTCPMHPQVHHEKPGTCPICGMNLVRKEARPPQ